MKPRSNLSNFLVFLAALLFIVSSCKKNDEETITDADGNLYTSVTIGTQVWMVENLKTTRFNDGTDIPLITENTQWPNASSPAYCWYDNNISNKEPFGALYNWHSVNTGKLCPAGWHVPTQNDWEELIDFLGGDVVAGGKLKTPGTIEGGDGIWYQPNVDATNETGFTAVPGGMRSADFFDINYGGVWWTSTEYSPERAFYYYINNYNAEIGDSDTGGTKNSGFSVRCMKD